MIVGKDVNGFLKKFFTIGQAQSFLLTGETEDMEDLLIRYLSCENKSFCKRCRGCDAQSIFDLRRYDDSTLKIEDARDIQWRANQSGIEGAKIFLLRNNYLAPEAQATLLKTLEEPYPNTYFILSSVPESALSRPLLSRLTIFKRLIIDPEKVENLKVGLQDILKYSESRESAEELLNKMEIWAEEKIKNTLSAQAGNPQSLKGVVSFVEDLYETKNRFFEKTYPQKMLLEHLVISKFYLES